MARQQENFKALYEIGQENVASYSLFQRIELLRFSADVATRGNNPSLGFDFYDQALKITDEANGELMRLFFLDLGDATQRSVGNLEMSLLHSGLARLLLSYPSHKQGKYDAMALGLAAIELGREAGDFQAEVMVFYYI